MVGGRIEINNKMKTQNIFLNKKWQEDHLKTTNDNAGIRYTPELNVSLKIAENFDAISKTRSFFDKIRGKRVELESKQLSFWDKENPLSADYTNIQTDTKSLIKLLLSIKKYSNQSILWDRIKELSKKIEENISTLDKKIHELKETQLDKNKLDNQIYELRKLRDAVGFFNYYSENEASKLSNKPFLLLKGQAGVGKTHLLCDIFNLRFRKEYPTVFLMGESFQKKKNFWTDLRSILKIKDYIKNKVQLLKLLDESGKKSKSRALIVIDAINESSEKYWNSNLKTLIQDIKKYNNIALIISIREGYERKILKKTQKEFVEIKHHGFEDEVIWNATKIYFKHYKIKFSDFPIFNPEFRNPLFLKLFCEKFRNSRIKERSHNFLKDIFEHFVITKGEEILKDISFRRGKNITPRILWNKIVKEIATKMADSGKPIISKRSALKIIKRYYTKDNANKILIRMKINLMLEFKIGLITYYKFSYNKFSDHLIVRYVLANSKRKKNPLSQFDKNKYIGKILQRFSYDSGIIEAFCIQVPEFFDSNELIQLAPYLEQNHYFFDAFNQSLIWRKPNFIGDKLINIIKINILKKNRFFLDAMISLSAVPNHKLNALLLHELLSQFSLLERDSFWTVHVNSNFDSESAIDRLVQWSLENYDYPLSKDAKFLACVTLSWFLTSSNRFLRDKSTKSIILLLKNDVDVLLKIMKQFEKVNDLYIKERLFAVVYSVALINQNDHLRLKELAQYVYDVEFIKNKPTPHILLRDYSLQTIRLAINKRIKLKLKNKNLNYPFKSKFPKIVISEKRLKKLYDKYPENINDAERGLLLIWSSVMGGGDFERYIIGTNSNFFRWFGERIGSRSPKLSTFNLSIAQRWIFNRVMNLGWKKELHGEYDSNINRNNYGRGTHKVERIGKKYQWIAYHEFIARISDNFKFKASIHNDKIDQFLGAWDPNMRDFDPTLIINEESIHPKLKKILYKIDKPKNDLAWLKNRMDIPNPKILIEQNSDNIKWLNLEGFFEWESKPDNIKNKKRFQWFIIKSYIIKKSDFNNFLQWAKKQNFIGRWMPESEDFSQFYIGEYPFSESYNDTKGGYPIWTDTCQKNLPCKMVITNDTYYHEFNLDCSNEGSISISLPCKFLIEKMCLKNNLTDGVFYNARNDITCFSNSILDKKQFKGLFISKDEIMGLLKKEKYILTWVVIGEKNLINNGSSYNDWQGRLNVHGFYFLKNNKIVGKAKKYFSQ